MTIAAVGSFVLASGADGPPATRYVVATRTLAPGDILTASDLTLVAIDLPQSQRDAAFTSVASLVDAVMRGPLDAGGLLAPAAVNLPGASADVVRYREVSFAVPRARALDGSIRPGDRVDILSSSDTDTIVLTEQATVIAVSGSSSGGLTDNGDLILTLALPDAKAAVAVAHGSAGSDLTVIRSTRATDRLPDRYRPGGAPAPTATPAPAAPAATAVR